jgi:acetylornithine deacetylase
MNEKIKIPENIIIGEPTNNEILTGSKGLLEFEMEFKGKSAHSSNPGKGINAIENCMDFLGELKRFYEFFKSEIDERFEIPYTTMNIRKNNWWKKYKYSSK